jgi:hypothetical protein
LFRKVKPEALTGFHPRIQLTGAATFDSTRDEGGTFNDVKEVFGEGWTVMEHPLYDLETGKPKGHIRLEKDQSNFGDWLFHGCLAQILLTKPEILRRVYLTVVAEPGKARSVTKTDFALKIVLD